MAIAFIDDNVTVNAGGGTTTGTRPTGVGAGHLLCASWIIYDTDATGTSYPAGWTQIAQGYNAAGGNSFTLKTAWAAGDVATLDFVGPSNYTNLYLAGYSGHLVATPIDSGAGAPTYNEAESGVANATGTGITVTDANSYLVFAEAGYSEGLTGAPSGMTARELNFDGVNTWADQSVSAGATGDKTVALNNNAVFSVVMFAIRPDGGGGGGAVATVDHSSTLGFPAFCRRPANDGGRWTRGEGGLWEPRRTISLPPPLRKAA